MADKTKILVVEDEEMLAATLRDMLLQEGYEVDLAVDGEQALRKALDMRPDLILLDIVLPKMDGLTMLQQFKESEDDGKETEVIILTNLSDRETVLRAIKSNCYDYLVKTDWDLPEVITKVKEKLAAAAESKDE